MKQKNTEKKLLPHPSIGRQDNGLKEDRPDGKMAVANGPVTEVKSNIFPDSHTYDPYGMEGTVPGTQLPETEKESKDFDAVLLGKQIQIYRKRLGYYQKDLAEKAGLKEYVISQIETGARKCSLSNLVSIANALQVSPDVLLFGNFQPEHSNFYPYLMEMAELIKEQVIKSIDSIFANLYQEDRKKHSQRYDYKARVEERKRRHVEDPILRKKESKKITDPNLDQK